MEEKIFHITIKNTKSNEVVCDEDSDCILGAFDCGKTISQMGLTNCKGLVLLQVAEATMKILKKCTVVDNNDSAWKLLLLKAIKGEMKDGDKNRRC